MSASVHSGNSGNLPAESNTFIGREPELARISALLGTTRLLTLTGPGGVGKSRLALRAAHAARTAFPGGVWLVELSDLQNPDLLTNAVAEATRLAEQTLRPLLVAVCEHLDDGPRLLVLDTCEHVLDECARVVQQLLAQVPRLRVLATSRQPLGVPGEHLLPVTPLPVGEHSDAVALFTARAAAAVPSFTLTDANRADVAAVCARLDGIPLALELAAVRLRGFPLDRLLQGLDSRFDLLVSPSRPRLARHQTLRTAIGWSHELCTPLERLLWARLSVFAGGWDVEAAEFVCHGGPLDAEEILAMLASLTEKSIVTRESNGVAGRYRMLDTLRTFGADWLEGLGEQDAVRVRHLDYYRWIARQGEAEWLGPGQRMWAERLSVEHANLRVALEESLAAPDPRTALELTGTLWYFWFACGFAEEGRGYLERALRRVPDDIPGHTLATWAHRLVTVAPDDVDAAESVSAAYVWLAQERGLPVPALPLTGASLAVRGESARSALLYGSGTGGPGGGGGAEFFQLLTLAVQAYLLAGQGAFERCAVVAERLRVDCAKRGELWMRAWGDFFVALAGIGLGRPARDTLRSARRALAAKWRVHDRFGAAAVADLLIAAEEAGGESVRAARLLGAGTRLWHSAGLPQLSDMETTVFRREYARRLRAALGDAAFAEAVREGRSLSPEAAIHLALGGPPDGPDL